MTGGGAQTPLRGPVGAGVGLSAPNIGLVPRRGPTTGGAAGVHSPMRSRAWQDELESSSEGELLAGPGLQVDHTARTAGTAWAWRAWCARSRPTSVPAVSPEPAPTCYPIFYAGETSAGLGAGSVPMDPPPINKAPHPPPSPVLFFSSFPSHLSISSRVSSPACLLLQDTLCRSSSVLPRLTSSLVN
ncbi:hypothetical protein VTN00DRAFT_1430 [Thermoascus crustaceus]|uniref:uncharacterized protein n=1 Tax=Thermoascus crustaceus TaxID=5088 RepID=UPI003741FF1A